jgi:hypothetical protein
MDVMLHIVERSSKIRAFEMAVRSRDQLSLVLANTHGRPASLIVSSL